MSRSPFWHGLDDGDHERTEELPLAVFAVQCGPEVNVFHFFAVLPVFANGGIFTVIDKLAVTATGVT